MNLYIGNLAYELTENELRKAFNDFGDISSLKIIVDRFSGKSRGFGFIEMATKEEGQKAIDGANGLTLQGKAIVVNEARPKENNRQR